MNELVGPQVYCNWANLDSQESGDLALNHHSAMNGFLKEVERRALRIAELATGNWDDALEIVQDTMLGLVRRYSRRPEGEWRPLFYRILQSRINDFHRRRAVRQKITGWLPQGKDASGGENPLENVSAGTRGDPVHNLQQSATNTAVTEAISALPTRQQQAFLLRAWEGLSVRDSAIAMNCSEGSVKTHYSRAIRALQKTLAESGHNDYH